MVSCSYDNCLIRWEFDKQLQPKYIDTLIGHSYFVNQCQYIHNDNYILSRSYDGTVRLWNNNTNQCEYVFIHSKELVCIKIYI